MIQSVDAASQSCQSCHGSYREAGLSMYSSQPLVASAENTLRWTVSAPWRNDWIEPNMEITVLNGIVDNTNFVPWQGNLAAGSSISGWLNVTPDHNATEIEIAITLDVVAYYDHASSKRPDRQFESVRISMVVIVEQKNLALSPSLVSLEEGNNQTSSKLFNLGSQTITELNGTAQRGIVRFAQLINTSGEITTTNYSGSLEPGWGVIVSYTGPEPASNGTDVLITGKLPSGVTTSASMSVIPIPIPAQLPDPPLSGKVAVFYGWLGVVVLGLLMVQGFSKRALDRIYKDNYKSAKKQEIDWDAEMPAERATYWWWLHYSLLGAVITFTAIHVLGFGISDTMPPLSADIWLGIIAIAIIAIAGYSGLYPKLSRKYLPWFSFRKGHMILAIIGTILALWHSYILW